MKKSLSLFVASSMVVSMFAGAAYAADEKTPGEFLNELGVIQGNGTDLKEDQKWQRQDVVVLLSRLLGEEEEAADADKTHEFTDVTDAFYDSFISWAVEEGLVEGKGNGKFGFKAELKNQEFFAIVLRAFGVDTTGEGYAEVPALAVEYGFATEETDMSAVPTRGETYATIVTALNTEVPGTGQTLGQKLGLIEVTEVQASAAATGAKKITVTFNQAVDTAKAAIAVKNSNVAVNVKETTWAEDKKSVVLEFGNALAAAEYTVSVTGLTSEALTSTVKVEAEKVSAVKFQSDKAPLNRGVNDVITLGYVVENQYGEDITSSTALTASASKGAATAANGVVTIDAGAGFYNINEQVIVNLVHVNGTYATTTATVSAEARVASIAVTELYQADDKVLEVGGAAADTFKLILDLKDQYGNSITSDDNLNADILTSVSNTAVASVNGYNASTNAATFAEETIDGVKKIVLALDDTVTAGTSTVTFISKTSGAKATYDVVVKDSVKIDVLTLSAPASAPAGSTVEIPFTAVDQFGAAIAHPTNAMINSASITGDGTVEFKKDAVKNTTSLKVTLPSTKGTAILTVLTGTNKVAQLTINVTDASVASVISGTKDLTTAVLKNGAVSLGDANIVVKDQYNNDKAITYSTVAGQVNGTYRVVATSSNSNVTINNGGLVYDDQALTLTGATKGSATITLKLEKNTAANGATPVWTEVTNSSYSFTFKVVEKADIQSYEATVAGPLYTTTNADYAKAVEVKGVLADGSKVVIPNVEDNYTVTVNTTGVTYNAGKVIADGSVALTDGKAEVPVLVLVKGATTTELVTVTANVSNATPAVSSLELKTVAPATKVDATTISVAAATDVDTQPELETVIKAAVVAKDQYGVELTAETYAAIVATNFDGAENLAGLGSGDSFTVTAITTNNQTIKIKVIVE